MCKKKGFTLLELLIAAAIIAVLAMFATRAFRQSASDIRLQDAQARAKVIAMSAHRMKVEYPGVKFSTADDAIGQVSAPNGSYCYPTAAAVTIQTLVDCGYLDYRQYAAEVYEETEDEDTYASNFTMFFPDEDSYKVCVKGNTSKILDKRCYCTDGESVDTPTNCGE